MNTRAKLLIQKKGENPVIMHPAAEGEDGRSVREVMCGDYSFCRADDPYEQTIQKMREQGLTWLPIVDAHRRIIGIVTMPTNEGGADSSSTAETGEQ